MKAKPVTYTVEVKLTATQLTELEKGGRVAVVVVDQAPPEIPRPLITRHPSSWEAGWINGINAVSNDGWRKVIL